MIATHRRHGSMRLCLPGLFLELGGGAGKFRANEAGPRSAQSAAC